MSYLLFNVFPFLLLFPVVPSAVQVRSETSERVHPDSARKGDEGGRGPSADRLNLRSQRFRSLDGLQGTLWRAVTLRRYGPRDRPILVERTLRVDTTSTSLGRSEEGVEDPGTPHPPEARGSLRITHTRPKTLWEKKIIGETTVVPSGLVEGNRKLKSK